MQPCALRFASATLLNRYRSYSLILKIRYSRAFFVPLAARSLLNTMQR